MQTRCVLRTAIALGACAWPALASAQQSIGTFRWQLTPYCNVVTLNVAAQGAVFTLDGFDDQCGAGERAGVVGTAFLNPDGTVGIGLTTVIAPGGAFVHVDARVDLASLGGPWRDSSGNSGTFVVTPGASTGGSARPVAPNGIAPGSVSASQIAPGAVGAPHLAPGAVSGVTIADGTITSADMLDSPRAAFAGATELVHLSSTATVVQSVTLSAPAAGRVLASASAHLVFDNLLVANYGGCSLNTQPSYHASGNLAWEAGAAAITNVPVGPTRGFSVAAGPVTVYLVCFSDGDESTFLRNPHLTALFVAGS